MDSNSTSTEEHVYNERIDHEHEATAIAFLTDDVDEIQGDDVDEISLDDLASNLSTCSFLPSPKECIKRCLEEQASQPNPNKKSRPEPELDKCATTLFIEQQHSQDQQAIQQLRYLKGNFLLNLGRLNELYHVYHDQTADLAKQLRKAAYGRGKTAEQAAALASHYNQAETHLKKLAEESNGLMKALNYIAELIDEGK